MTRVWQVTDTPHKMTFLSVLQHLLQIDANDEVGDIIWETVDKLVLSASMLSGRRSDAERLLADGARRLNRSASGPRQRRSGQCSSTCQCLCHDDESPTANQLPTSTGTWRTRQDTNKICLLTHWLPVTFQRKGTVFRKYWLFVSHESDNLCIDLTIYFVV